MPYIIYTQIKKRDRKKTKKASFLHKDNKSPGPKKTKKN